MNWSAWFHIIILVVMLVIGGFCYSIFKRIERQERKRVEVDGEVMSELGEQAVQQQRKLKVIFLELTLFAFVFIVIWILRILL